jgi:hypothetical protein
MSTSAQIRQKIADLVRTRAGHDKKAAEARQRQAKKSDEANSYRLRAGKASSPSMARSYLGSAASADKAVSTEANKVADESRRAAECTAKEAALNKDLIAALAREATAEKRTQDRRETETRRLYERQALSARQQHERDLRAERARTDELVAAAERRLTNAMSHVRPPKAELLRILYLTASSDGGLRVDEEIRRVKAGVRAATHRDLIQIEHMPAATVGDLLDGLARLRPHVVHFSGHADSGSLVFDTGSDDPGPGQVVKAESFAKAMGTVDSPPVLVVLNACESEAHLSALLDSVPLAIGMSDKIGDADAMAFAARFYTTLAEGQSVESAFNMARVQMELSGLADADLPVLMSDIDVDARAVVLVVPAP